MASWAAALLAAALLSCGGGAGIRTAASVRPPASSPQDRIARELAAASPPADPADPAARDAAAGRLAGVAVLLNAQEEILWGGFDEKKGYDPAAYRLTAFNPLVWTKIYLSTFMFPGPYEVRTEGRDTVLEMAARFRSGLDPGDYPYPFWHSRQKWDAYVGTEAVILVFRDGRLTTAFRKAGKPAEPGAARAWDGRWHWTDARGEQPRAALFSYLLSAGNPHREKLDATYRRLEASFRSQHCLGCHSPDNTAQADQLFLLSFPNQALAARHLLVPVLRGNKMPPAECGSGQAAGIADDAARAELIRLAGEFEREGDAALAYESGYSNPAFRARRSTSPPRWP